MAIEKINMSTCIGCGVCENVCAVDVIRMDLYSQKPQIKYPLECMLCEMCSRECPVGAIEFTPQKNIPPMISYA